MIGRRGGILGLCLLLLGGARGAFGAQPEHVPLGRRVAERLRAAGFSEDAAIVTIAALPIVELRGAVPVGYWMKTSARATPLDRLGEKLTIAGRVLGLAVLGNMIPVPLILLLLGPISNLISRNPAGKRAVEWLFARTRRKSAEIEKYETLGLMIFVAIPLPATGAWTGAMAAFLLGMSFRHSLWSILLGVLIAGGIMTALTLLGWWGAGIAAAALLSLAFGALSRALRAER